MLSGPRNTVGAFDQLAIREWFDLENPEASYLIGQKPKPGRVNVRIEAIALVRPGAGPQADAAIAHLQKLECPRHGQQHPIEREDHGGAFKIPVCCAEFVNVIGRALDIAPSW